MGNRPGTARPVDGAQGMEGEAAHEAGRQMLGRSRGLEGHWEDLGFLIPAARAE